MATYTPVSSRVPSDQRTTIITEVAEGDQIAFQDVLGRPARGIQLYTDSDTDTLEYRLNGLRRSYVDNEAVDTWVPVDSFTQTGATQYQTVDGLRIGSIEIVALTGPTEITIICW